MEEVLGSKSKWQYFCEDTHLVINVQGLSQSTRSLVSIFRSSLAYGELEERLELVESSLAPVSPHLEERLELLESMLSRDQEEELAR